MLAVVEIHPVQYHAPVFRAVQQECGVPLTAIYGSDFSVAGYRDREFGAEFKWDTDLLSGYESRFLSRVADGGGANYEEVSAQGLRAALRDIKPGAVLLLGYTPRFNRTAFYEVWRGGYPLLFRGETADHAFTRSPAKAVIRDAALRLLYSRIARVLPIGRRSRQHYERLGCAAEKMVFAPYCVDVTPFQCDEEARLRLRAETRREWGFAEDETVAVFSGKLSPRKGPDVLLKAAKALPDERREKLRVLFVGEGELKGELQALAARPPLVKTTFAGFQNQTQLSRFYHAADFLAMPSLWGETWGLVVNEALHHGLPCVISDAVGSAPDLIKPGETGETFAAGDAESLAAALRRVTPLLGRAVTRQACRALVGGYSVSAAAQGIAQAYREVARAEI